MLISWKSRRYKSVDFFFIFEIMMNFSKLFFHRLLPLNFIIVHLRTYINHANFALEIPVENNLYVICSRDKNSLRRDIQFIIDKEIFIPTRNFSVPQFPRVILATESSLFCKLVGQSFTFIVNFRNICFYDDSMYYKIFTRINGIWRMNVTGEKFDFFLSMLVVEEKGEF